MGPMRFPAESSTDVIQRLRRLEGQIRGIQRMVDEGAECRDVVTQLAAAKAALDRVGFKLMAAGMRECARDGADLDAEELEQLFLKLS
jgi:CsoR family transcriptional regulator, copper-sensing transcriptional repressor